MTTISIEELREHLDQYLAEAARGDVIVTQAGKPIVVLRAFGEEVDEPAPSREFWKGIHDRRQEVAIPWEQAKSELERDD